ncbi:MAG: helix-turn-helix transcriptional regulator [Pseudomonadota bacterium]
MVISASKLVATLNDSASQVWNARRGDVLDMHWLDPISRPDFEAVCRTAKGHGNRGHVILRTRNGSGASGLAEAFLFGAETRNMVAIRALRFDWTKDVGVILEEAFVLTRAEQEICRLLLEYHDTSEIAEQRRASVHTVRTQLRTIFSKTETKSQVDLTRLLAMLCSRVSLGKKSMSAAWTDPLAREEIIQDTDGRDIAFTWAGDPDGKPALMVHGMVTGYMFPAGEFERLRANGIKLFMINRPGFGNSTPNGDVGPIQAGADAIVQLARHLQVTSWRAIGLASGGVPLVRAARVRESGLTEILNIQTHLPFAQDDQLDHFPTASKVTLRLARSSAELATTSAQNLYQLVKLKGAEYLAHVIYNDCEADRAALENSECRAFLQTAQAMLINFGSDAIGSDLEIIASDWADDLTGCPIPLHFLYGAQSTTHSTDRTAKLLAASPQATNEMLDDAGKLIFFSHSHEIIDRFVALGADD